MSDEIKWCWSIDRFHWYPADSRGEALEAAVESLWDEEYIEEEGDVSEETVYLGHRQTPELSEFVCALSLLESIDERSNDEARDVRGDRHIFDLRPWYEHHAKMPGMTPEARAKRKEDKRRVDELQAELVRLVEAFAKRYGYEVPWWRVVGEHEVRVLIERDQDLFVESWKEVEP